MHENEKNEPRTTKSLRHMQPRYRWALGQLAPGLRAHKKQISDSEYSSHFPSTEVLTRMASLFECSLDFFAFNQHPDAGADSKIVDRELLEKLQVTSQHPEQDRDTIKVVLDSPILKNRVQRLAAGH